MAPVRCVYGLLLVLHLALAFGHTAVAAVLGVPQNVEILGVEFDPPTKLGHGLIRICVRNHTDRPVEVFTVRVTEAGRESEEVLPPASLVWRHMIPPRLAPGRIAEVSLKPDRPLNYERMVIELTFEGSRSARREVPFAPSPHRPAAQDC